jgi:hypothetical protein
MFCAATVCCTVDHNALLCRALLCCAVLCAAGVAIACDGTVPFRSGERIGFNYLVSQVCVCGGGGCCRRTRL